MAVPWVWRQTYSPPRSASIGGAHSQQFDSLNRHPGEDGQVRDVEDPAAHRADPDVQEVHHSSRRTGCDPSHRPRPRPAPTRFPPWRHTRTSGKTARRSAAAATRVLRRNTPFPTATPPGLETRPYSGHEPGHPVAVDFGVTGLAPIIGAMWLDGSRHRLPVSSSRMSYGGRHWNFATGSD
jgi:hypothetical protein